MDILSRFAGKQHFRSGTAACIRIQRWCVSVAMLILAAGIGAAQERHLTGVLSDTVCGAHHMMADDAQCVRACIKQQGAKYALVAGRKIYVLEYSGDLGPLANKRVSVTGTVSGDTIQVLKVRELPARSSP